MRRAALGLVAVVLAPAAAVAAPKPETRNALVIGSAAYADAPLPNALNDARDMASALERRTV